MLCVRLFGLRAGTRPSTVTSALDFEDHTWRFNPFLADATGLTEMGWRRVCAAPPDVPPWPGYSFDQGPTTRPTYSIYQYLETAAMMPLRAPDYDVTIIQVGGLRTRRLDLGSRTAPAPRPAWIETGPRWVRGAAPDRVLPSDLPAPLRERLRRHGTGVLTPDGRMLIVGGSDGNTTATTSIDTIQVREVEQYDPIDDRWSTLARLEVGHGYHHTALLLPDGRVWVATGLPTDPRAPEVRHYENRIELFSPPYLGRRPAEQRPRIIRLDRSRVAPEDPVTIFTPDADAIEIVALLRCGSVTHGFNADQRHVVPQITARSAEWLRIALPDPLVLIPGWYLVFIIDSLEVPSVATFLNVVSTFGPTPPFPADPAL